MIQFTARAIAAGLHKLSGAKKLRKATKKAHKYDNKAVKHADARNHKAHVSTAKKAAGATAAVGAAAYAKKKKGKGY